MNVRIVFWVMGAALCARAETVASRLDIPVLPGQGLASYNLVYGQLRKKDVEADRAFADCKEPAAFRKRQEDIRARWVDSFGGFPERTPLNPVFGRTFERDGYTVTTVCYESQPKFYVTALLYRPANPAFKPPYPCLLLPCGHNAEGKAGPRAQHAARLAARQGFIALCYDPIEQGERVQVDGYTCTAAHNIIGTRAALLGWNTARFRIWDGIRSMDFLETLPDADMSRLGVMGNSGGGTLTSYLMSLDPRVKAGAPSCFITSLRDHCGLTGPHDAEQNLFGQLDYGLNHTAFLLMRAPDLPVCVNAVHDDLFPIDGTRSTVEIARQAYACFGIHDINPTRPGPGSPLGLIDVPGEHAWKEGLVHGSLAWMRAKLTGDKEALPYDIDNLRKMVTPKNENLDGLLMREETFFTPKGFVRDIPGNRTTFDLMRDRLAQMDQAAPMWRDIGKKAAIEKALRFDTFPVEKAEVSVLSDTPFDGFREIRQTLRVNHGEGMTNVIPLIVFIPDGNASAPMIYLSHQGRNSPQTIEAVTTSLAQGKIVVVMDVLGIGEIGKIRGDGGYYNFEEKHANENVAVMLYLLGRSVIEFQTREILAAATAVSERFGGTVHVDVDSGDFPFLLISAKHAEAYDNRKHIQNLSCVHPAATPPLSWRDVITREPLTRDANPDRAPHYLFSNIIHGALRYYDWTDL